MRGTTFGLLGVIALFLTGFVRGGLSTSADPDLIYACAWDSAAGGS